MKITTRIGGWVCRRYRYTDQWEDVNDQWEDVNITNAITYDTNHAILTNTSHYPPDWYTFEIDDPMYDRFEVHKGNWIE